MKIRFGFILAYYWKLNEINRKCCYGYFHTCLCCQGLSITFRHHLGTIAFGSSIIAIIDTIRSLIDLIKDRMETMNLNGYGKCCLTLIKGSLNCIRCCFEFLSRYTYIMVELSFLKTIFFILFILRQQLAVNGFVHHH